MSLQIDTPLKTLLLTIPLTPPSVNHYKIPVVYRTREGMRKGFAITPEGQAFKDAVAIFAQGRTLSPSGPAARAAVRYALSVRIHFGPGQRGDGDNFWKCIADGLVGAGVIHSDARVKLWVLIKHDEDRDNPRNPRTEIRVSVLKPRRDHASTTPEAGTSKAIPTPQPGRIVVQDAQLAGKYRRGERCLILRGSSTRAQVRFEDGTVAIVHQGALRAPKKENCG